MRYALVFPMEEIIWKNGEHITLRPGVKRLIARLSKERVPCAVIIGQRPDEGEKTYKAVKALINRENPFRFVAYRTCRDPLSLIQDYFFKQEIEVMFTFYPLGLVVCECGRFCFPKNVYIYNKKEKKEYLCVCSKTWEE
jgi:hypothetical protein